MTKQSPPTRRALITGFANNRRLPRRYAARNDGRLILPDTIFRHCEEQRDEAISFRVLIAGFAKSKRLPRRYAARNHEPLQETLC